MDLPARRRLNEIKKTDLDRKVIQKSWATKTDRAMSKHDINPDKQNQYTTCVPVVVQTRTKLYKTSRPVKKTATKDVKRQEKKVDTKDLKQEQSQNTKKPPKSLVKDEAASAREDAFFNTAKSDLLRVYLKRREWEYTPYVPTIRTPEPHPELPEGKTQKINYSPAAINPETVEQVIDNYLKTVKDVERDLKSKSLSIGLPTIVRPDASSTAAIPVECDHTLRMVVSWENLMLILIIVLTMLLLVSVPQIFLSNQ